jgi:hypothetical protein
MSATALVVQPASSSVPVANSIRRDAGLVHRRNVDDSGGQKSVSAIRRFVHKIQKKYIKLVLFLLCLSCMLEFTTLAIYVYAEEFTVAWDQDPAPTPLHYNRGGYLFAVQSVISWFLDRKSTRLNSSHQI